MYPALLIGLAVTVGAPAPKETPKKKEDPTIIGSWTLEKAEFGGMALPAGAIGGELSLTFKQDGTIIATKGGKVEPDKANFTHDPKKTPAEFDMSEPRGGGQAM